jgi:anti-sigma B factor antagonist
VEFQIDDENGVTVVRLHGSIDASQAMQLRELLGDQISGPGARVLVDLTDVRLIDSSGIGILVTAHRRADASGARFAVAKANPAVAKVLQMTRTDQLLSVYDELEPARAALAGG